MGAKAGMADVELISSFLLESKGNNKSAVFVLCQGIPNAQGGDVLVFKLEKQKRTWVLGLESIQAKNWHKKRYASAMNEAATSVGVATRSIGVDATAGSTATPEAGSAGYSYAATLKLLQLVASTLKDVESYDRYRRIIVFAYKQETRSPTDQKNVGELVELWSREMLEPTISALKIAQDDDEANDAEDLAIKTFHTVTDGCAVFLCTVPRGLSVNIHHNVTLLQWGWLDGQQLDTEEGWANLDSRVRLGDECIYDITHTAEAL
eukprot:scaffold8742_cov56-Attheya_sp.AAC.1